MVIDNFTSYDLQWMISDKALGFFRAPQTSQPVNVANDNNERNTAEEAKKIS
jgi:hypothetical protein